MNPLLSTYRYGSERRAGEGLRLGTARYVPRGVRRTEWQRQGYFDLWLPLLAPDPDAIREFLHGEMTFAQFTRKYHSAMKKKESWQVIELLAGISLFLPISLGCYCEDESRCHRSLLKKLIEQEAKRRRGGFAGLRSRQDLKELSTYASPVCFAADWERDS